MATKKDHAQMENDALNKSEAFFETHKKVVSYSVVAILVIIGAIFAFNAWNKSREEKASTELGRAQEYFNQEQFDKALNGDGMATKGFAKLADEYSGTKAGNLAKLYSGLCYANLGKWQQAVDNLDDFSTKDDAAISPAAEAALGNAYAHVNQLDKAVDHLKKAAKMADSKSVNKASASLSPTFLLQAGEILESQGKKADALKLYQEIKAKYLTSQLVQSSEIDKYIERASR